jgi:hypothetical protein
VKYSSNVIRKNMVFNPTLSRKRLQKEFSKLQKLNYNQFRWWRMYDVKNKPLDKRKPLRDRILNGDYDFSHYWYQAMWCEHEINDLFEQYKDDVVQYVDKTKMVNARRKRLMEDFDRDEHDKLNELYNEFPKYFRVNRNQVKEEMANFSGSLIDFYYYMDDKYKIVHLSYEQIKKRGRPRKTA